MEDGGVGKERVRDVRSGFEREILRVGCACGVGVEMSSGSSTRAEGVMVSWSGMSWSWGVEVGVGSSALTSRGGGVVGCQSP